MDAKKQLHKFISKVFKNRIIHHTKLHVKIFPFMVSVSQGQSIGAQIRRCEVRILTWTQNIFFVSRSWKEQKTSFTISLTSSKIYLLEVKSMSMPREGVAPQNFVPGFHPEFQIFNVLFIRIVLLANERHILKSKLPFWGKNGIDVIVIGLYFQ